MEASSPLPNSPLPGTIFSLPNELQTDIFSFVFEPLTLRSVCHHWKNLTHLETDRLLNIFEKHVGVVTAEESYHSIGAVESSLQKLMVLFSKQEKKLVWLIGDEPAKKFQGPLSFARFIATEQWIRDYNFLQLCKNSYAFPDEFANKVEIALSLILSGEFNIEPVVNELRELFQRLDFSCTKSLCYEYSLTEIPREIGHFSNLQSLHFVENKLNRLPEEFFTLSQLVDLDLDKNEFTKVPVGISQLKALKNLTLSNNPLVELSSELEKLPQLEMLYISNRFKDDLIIKNLIERNVSVEFKD